MFSFLKNHPFAVEAHFENSTVLTFAVHKEQLQALIPECLQLDTFNDTWAFIAVAMVQTKELRPKGFPKFIGNDFFLIGYRIFVRFTNKVGKRLRGLYIIKSETDKKKMQLLGNIFTHYNYTTTDILNTLKNGIRKISSIHSGFDLSIDTAADTADLPAGSPFMDWKEARRFAGPLPFTFTCNEKNKTILVIEGVRKHWDPKPLKIISCHFAFLESLDFKNAVLANAFIIEDIPYYWKKGKIEKWNS